MNKKNPLIYSIVLITILVSNVLSAQSIDSTLQRAKILYDTQQYDSVIVLYNQLISSGNVSDKLYFNLANAYYKQREIAQAILWYERALVLDPYNDDIRNNLRIAQASQPDKVEQIQESLFQI
nr:tetratricopeptide repeat protein [Bacteroidales bacterium]